MRTPELVAASIGIALSIGLSLPAAAQYKWVGPGGAVTYSDQPPPPDANGSRLDSPMQRPSGGLPAPLATAASRYPVTLYTTKDCAPCQQARALLGKRGVPFSERSVVTANDADAFKRAGFTDNSFPTLTVGRERAVGLDGAQWERLLDAAGYPKASMLPAGWRTHPASPLAAADAAKAAAGANDAGGMIAVEPNAQAADGQDAARARGPKTRIDPREIAGGSAPAAAAPASSIRF